MAIIDYASSLLAARARELRADRILPWLDLHYGLADYVSWSKTPQSIVQAASRIEGGLQLRMQGVEYCLTTSRESDNATSTSFVCFKLTEDRRPVYEAKYLEIGEYDEPVLVSVARLEEGAWLHDFRALVDERKKADIVERKQKGLDEDLHDLTDNEFYGCSPTLAETLESRCGYAKGPLFPEGCPLRGSERVLNLADGPFREWMCDYHWAVFSGTVENFSRNETSVAGPTSPKVKQVSRPRRCEWEGCSHLVADALVISSRLPGVSVECFFCEEHRPFFLNWVNDRSQKVRLRLGPALRKKVQLWFASRRNQRRQDKEDQ